MGVGRHIKQSILRYKKFITKIPGNVLQFCNVDKPVYVEVDASQHGLRAVLLGDNIDVR